MSFLSLNCHIIENNGEMEYYGTMLDIMNDGFRIVYEDNDTIVCYSPMVGFRAFYVDKEVDDE